MARNQKDATYDHEMLMKDAGLVAVSAAATVASVARVQDMGNARVDARIIVDIIAAESATGDELYTVEVQVSNSPTFASTVFIAAAIRLGAAGTTFESVATAIGRREIAFTNEINGVVYRHVRLFTRVVGTIATGVNYRAYAVVEA